MNRLSLFANRLRALARRLWLSPVDPNRDPLVAMCDHIGADKVIMFPTCFAVDFPDPMCGSRLVTVSKSPDALLVYLTVSSVAQFKPGCALDELKAIAHLRNKPGERYEWRANESEHGMRITLTYTAPMAEMNADTMYTACTALRNEACALDTQLVKMGII